MSYCDYPSACEERGRSGEEYLLSELSQRLQPFGLVVRHTAADDKSAPFDLEVLDGPEVLVGIENKDLTPLSKGTWIKKSAKRRKQEHAKVNGIPKLLTTVTLRDAGQIGFRRGIENKPVASYDFSFEHLIEEILSARRA
jgi:hypothetical protein